MKKENILTYLEKKLIEILPERYDWALDWQAKKHRIAIYFRIFVENKTGQEIIDEEGVVASEIIEFEDVIYLCGGKEIPTDALYVYSFDRKKGIAQGVLDALVNQLLISLEDGESDLLDFVTDETMTEFELHWDEKVFQEQIKENQTGEILAYPKF